MQPNQQTTQLLNQTIDTFNGDAQVISPTDGVSLIDRWISALHSGGASTNPVASTLSELKAELQRGNPDSETIRTLLDQLSSQAKEAGNTVDEASKSSLNELAEGLQSFSQQLSGANGPAQTGDRAPMTSTTGDQSTAGVYSTDMDDQTGSNGGATGESGSQMYAGSSPDAGNTQGGGSYGSGYGTGSEGRQDAPNSGTSTTSDSSMDDNTSRSRMSGNSTNS